MAATVLRLDTGVTIEYQLASELVIFSHGFGVGRDGRGLLSDIARSLPPRFGYILFDYYDIDGQTVILTDITEQKRRLNAVLDWARQQEGVHHIHLIGHSRGCLVIAMLQPSRIDKIVLLAPPAAAGSRSRQYFTAKKGVKRRGHSWLVPRRDGTTSIIPDSVFDELENISAGDVLLSWADQHGYFLIVADQDEVLENTDYSFLSRQDGVTLIHLPGNHNFEEAARVRLVEKIKQLLTEK